MEGELNIDLVIDDSNLEISHRMIGRLIKWFRKNGLTDTQAVECILAMCDESMD